MTSTRTTGAPFVVITATSPEEALDKAMARARWGEQQYENVYGDVVTWNSTLVELGSALQDTFEDGTEIYARFFRNKAAYDKLDFENFGFEDFAKDAAEP